MQHHDPAALLAHFHAAGCPADIRSGQVHSLGTPKLLGAGRAVTDKEFRLLRMLPLFPVDTRGTKRDELARKFQEENPYEMMEDIGTFVPSSWVFHRSRVTKILCSTASRSWTSRCVQH